MATDRSIFKRTEALNSVSGARIKASQGKEEKGEPRSEQKHNNRLNRAAMMSLVLPMTVLKGPAPLRHSQRCKLLCNWPGPETQAPRSLITLSTSALESSCDDNQSRCIRCVQTSLHSLGLGPGQVILIVPVYTSTFELGMDELVDLLPQHIIAVRREVDTISAFIQLHRSPQERCRRTCRSALNHQSFLLPATLRNSRLCRLSTADHLASPSTPHLFEGQPPCTCPYARSCGWSGRAACPRVWPEG